MRDWVIPCVPGDETSVGGLDESAELSVVLGGRVAEGGGRVSELIWVDVPEKCEKQVLH